jgi:YHS domain-containing protein
MALRGVILVTGIGVMLVGFAALAGDDELASSGREIPAAFAPFEYLIGSWKGIGAPTANRIRGWNETHAWAWKFENGKPDGMSVTLEGNKVLAKGQLVFDPVSKKYALRGSDPSGKAVAFSGTLDKTGKKLTLDRIGTTTDGAKQQLTLFPNSNQVRYTVWVAEQERGAPQFKRVIEAGLTKEGEAFAAGAAASNLPKCIMTGGAATMTVSYQGKSFPVCCTGCRDEFIENPEKYIKKAALLAEAAAKGTTAKPATTRANNDDGTFDGLVDEPKEKSTAKLDKTVIKAEAVKTGDPTAKAASLLKLGQNLERAQKSSAALTYYRQIVKNFPDTPAAKTAAARIKALTAP